MAGRPGRGKFSHGREKVFHGLRSGAEPKPKPPPRTPPLPAFSDGTLPSAGCEEGFKLGCSPRGLTLLLRTLKPQFSPFHSHPPKHPPTKIHPQTQRSPTACRLSSLRHPGPRLCVALGAPSRPRLPAGAPRTAGTAPPRCVSSATAATSSRGPGLGESLWRGGAAGTRAPDLQPRRPGDAEAQRRRALPNPAPRCLAKSFPPRKGKGIREFFTLPSSARSPSGRF